MNNLGSTIRYFLSISVELTVLFIGISAIVSLVLMHIPGDKLRQWLSGRGLSSYVLGAVAGSLTPFCACSTIPMTLGLLNAGAPFGPVMSFLIASPLLNPVILGMVAMLMGGRACLLYFGITFAGSVVFGILLERAGGRRFVRTAGTGICRCGPVADVVPSSIPRKLKAALASAWDDFRAVLPYFLIGVAIGSVIYGYIPADFVAGVAGPRNPLAIPLAAVIGVPLYIRAETAIPIGLALIRKGMSMGAIIALVIGGAGMAIPEMSMLAALFRKRLVAAIAAVIFLTAVIGGYAFDVLL